MGAGNRWVWGRSQMNPMQVLKASQQRGGAAIDRARPFGGIFFPLTALYSMHIHPDVETQSAIQSRNEEIYR